MEASGGVQIPSKAVSEDTDVRKPTQALLQGLNLLGTDAEDRDASRPAAAFLGPPQSVALIEAGATAASKWWASGLGGSVIAAWVAITRWWPGQELTIQVAVLAGAAVVTAVVIAAIGYLIGSDIRARGVAAVAIIEARAELAAAMIQGVKSVYTPTPAAYATEIIALPGPIRAKNFAARPTDDAEDWRAIAIERQPDGTTKYILVKGSSEMTVAPSELEFSS